MIFLFYSTLKYACFFFFIIIKLTNFPFVFYKYKYTQKIVKIFENYIFFILYINMYIYLGFM